MAPGGFCEKSYSVSRFCRHPGHRLRFDLLGQRVRSNHTVHTGGPNDAADSARADAGSSACFAAAAFFFNSDARDSVDSNSGDADSGPVSDAQLEGQQRPGQQHAVRDRAQRWRIRRRHRRRFG